MTIRGNEMPAGGWRAEDELDPPGDPESVARTICLNLLDHRARTRSELAAALSRRGIPAGAADAVLNRFVEIGLINDVELAESFAMARHVHRGLARPVIAAQLRRRGVDDEVIGVAIAQIDPASELTAAIELARNRAKRMAGLDLQVQRRRLMGLLGRRGYSTGVSVEAVRMALQSTDDSPDEDDFSGLG